MDEQDCVFCKIARGEIESKKVYDDKNFFAILDIKPKAEGHTLIISKKHFKTLIDLPDTLGNEFMNIIKKVSLKILLQRKLEGFNLVINSGESAGQVIHHFHAHILPRKKDDGLRMIV